jgi:hypothetical protein
MIFVSFLVEKIKGETKIIFETLTKNGKHLKQKMLSIFCQVFVSFLTKTF